MSTPGFKPGEVVRCPKCGQEGRVAVFTVAAKGRRYTYLVVEHRAEYGRAKRKVSTARCVLQRISTGEAEKQVLPAGVEELRRRVEELERENASLRAQLERLQAENEQLRQTLVSVYNARLSYRKGREEQPLLVGTTERYYLKLVAKDKKTDKQIAALGLSPAEVRAVANGIIEALVSADFAAVRLDAWQQLEGVVARWL
jgi:chromosome segregation ATPase